MTTVLRLAALAALLVALAAAPVIAQDTDEEKAQQFVRDIQALPWQMGEGHIAGWATIKFGDQLGFLDAPATSRFLEINGNPPPRVETYTLAARDLRWFAIFSFDPSGYVKDDEKIDADDLLKSLKEGNSHAIEERKRLGYAPLYLDGWYVAPHYDAETKRLEWGTRLHAEDNAQIVNYTTRILGRSGVMSATLVSDPQNLDADVHSFKTALVGFDYNPGQRYAEFRSGDKVAEYGLAALVVGGAAAVAAKSGFGKFIIYGVIAVGAATLSFVKKLFGKKKTET